MRPTSLFFAAMLSLAVTAGVARAGAMAAQGQVAAFTPDVSVAISDDAPNSHPDITTTIDATSGPYVARVRVLTPAGGDIARDAEVPDSNVVGWIAGFSTIPAPDGTCSQRYAFDVPLVKQSADAASFPAFLRALAPGPHHIRFEADVAGTPVNVIVDDVVVNGEPRLQTTTYIGDPAHPAPNCAPYRSRLILDGMNGTIPITTAPPNSGPRTYAFTLTSRPDASGNEETAMREVTATAQPGIEPRVDGALVRFNAIAGASSYKTRGDLFYATNCDLTRRLVIREQLLRFFTEAGPDATSITLPDPPGPEYELSGSTVDISAYDAEGVVLARAPLRYQRDPAACAYAPGEEPVLTVEPASGSCTGTLTFRGSRFPAGVNVEITMPFYGSDGPGVHVATAPVAGDGTFAVTAALPAGACVIASGYPDQRAVFFAYNADEPKGLAIFAAAHYAATIPPGAGAIVGAPNTGSGPGSRDETGPWWLAAAGVTLIAAGKGVRRRCRVAKR